MMEGIPALAEAIQRYGVNMPVIGLTSAEHLEDVPVSGESPCILVARDDTWDRLSERYLGGLNLVWAVCVSPSTKSRVWGNNLPRETATIDVRGPDWDLRTAAAMIAADIREYTTRYALA